MEEPEDVRQRKAVLLGERNVDSVVGRARLQFQIEGAAKALAQREAPSAIDARSERRVDDKLHSAAFVEEALGDYFFLGRNRAQHSAAGDNVLHKLFRAGAVERAFPLKPLRGSSCLGRLAP